MGRKEAEEYNKQEILEWVGAGPKKEGKWELTEEQLQQLFPYQRGVIHYKPGFRYTKWEVSNGYIRWKPATKREFETYIQEPSFSQETIDAPQ
jgi:hypothetical protein